MANITEESEQFEKMLQRAAEMDKEIKVERDEACELGTECENCGS